MFSRIGQIVWSRERSWFYNQRPLLADVTGDARPDVLVIERDAGRLRVVALDAAGDEQWASAWSGLTPSPYALSVTAADLDGDGTIEVLGLDRILDGRTGETKAVLDLGGERAPELEPIAADLDGDGVLEVFTGGRVYALDGSLVWDVGGSPMEASGGAWLQADDDEALELFVAESHDWRLVDDSGITLVSDTLPIGAFDDLVPRPPCVADFDGDGRDEVVFAWSGVWTLFDPDDGEVAWASQPKVSWHPFTCTAVDLDVDGAFEVVASGLGADSAPVLLILDGATGAVLAEQPSGIWGGQVGVADIDLDGSAEIIAAGSTDAGPAGIEVWGHPEGGWPTTTANWSGHDHSDVNVNEDGTVISRPDPPMGHAGVFRGHLSGWGPGVDLAVDVTDTCVATCDLDDGLVRVGTTVSNLGAGHAASAISVALYADGPDGRVLLDRQPLASAPQAGTRAPGPTLTTRLADTRGRELVVLVDVDDAQPECHEANNEARVTIDACPP